MKIYLIGIAGTAMGAFAGLLKQAGHDVSGSDSAIYPPMSEKLFEWGIQVKTPYAASNITSDLDLVVVGNVVSRDHVEVLEMQRLGLAFKSFPQTLSELFLGSQKSMVATGTHGKTTISSLLAHTLFQAGKDPSFLIGGIPKNFKESFRLGKGDLFVLEGDEYDTAYFDKGPKFLHYQPFYLLCSSLEYDHADIYKNVDEIVDRFSQLISLVPAEGVVVLNQNSVDLKRALSKSNLKAKLIEYGDTELVLETEQGLELKISGKTLFVPLSGQHNAQNALGCYRILEAAGLSHEEIKSGFESFAGVKRRMEVIGEVRNIWVIDDFAHHPTAVRMTLEGAKKRYVGKKIWALFEPRSASSCRLIFQEAYAQSFAAADRVLLAPTGRFLGAEQSLDVKKLARDIGSKATACDSYEQIIALVKAEVSQNTVLLCMSNGAFGGIHQKLLEVL